MSGAVEDCALPADTLLDPKMIAMATFKDAYRTATQRAFSPTDAFFAIFAHHPWWMKAMLLARNAAMAPFVAVPRVETILRPERQASYAVGDTIGPWPIFGLNERELIAGRDNPHLDFRVSVFVEDRTATVSTICAAHNEFGRRYLQAIAPFHHWGMRHLLASAVKARRL